MAVLPQALEFSQTPISVLLSIAEQNRQEQLLKEKARLEDERARMALPMELVNAMDNLDSDIQNQYANSYLNSFSQAVKNKQIPTSALRDYAAKMVMDIRSKSGAVKQWKDGFNESVKTFDKNSGINVDQLKAAGSKYLLESVRDPSKLSSLQNPSDWVFKAVSEAPELFGSREAGSAVFNEILSKTPKADMTEIVKRDTTGNMMLTEKSGGKIPWWYTMKEGVGKTGLKTYTPVLKKDASGNIEENVFNSFYSYKDPNNPYDFRMRLWVDAGANDLIRNNNLGKTPSDEGYIDPNDEGSKALAKRRFLTNQLEMRPSYEAPRESLQDKSKPSAVFNIGGLGTPGGIQDPYDELSKQVLSGKPLKNLNTKYQDFILKTANELKPKAGGKIKYTNANTEIRDNNGVIELYDQKGNFIIPIDPQSFRTGILGEVSGKAKVEGFKADENNPPKKKVYNPKTGKFE